MNRSAATMRPVAAPKAGARISGRRRESLIGWALMTPFLIAYLLFFFWPALQTLRLSFTESGLTDTKSFVGLANYAELMQDGDFWGALLHTAYFALLTVIPMSALGLGLALLVNRLLSSPRLRVIGAISQALFFLPFVLPVAVMTLIVGWILHPNFGIVNLVFGGTRAWLNDADWAMPMVALATIWWNVGFNMLLFLAGLRNIPAELYEAAALDGATGWATFRYITWRQLRPVTAMVLMLQLLASLKIFAQPYILTNGGPFNSTRVMLHYMYETAFTDQNVGYASAIACAFLFLVLMIVGIQMLLMAWLNRRAAR
jgi:multiple sugar transport system permease protein